MKITAAVSRAGACAPTLEQLELGEPRADEILVRLVATGICHTDLHAHSGIGWPGPKPSVYGHEGAGVVEKVGEAVTHVKVGDHVVVSGGSCGNCPACLNGTPTYCREAMPRAFGCCRPDGTSALDDTDGEQVGSHFFAQSSFATHMVAQARGAVPVPKDIPLELVAPMACGIITGAGAVIEELQVRPGQSIVVFGVGGVGMAAVMAAKIAGASTIVAVDVVPERCELAKELGATHAVLSSEDTLAALREILPNGADFSFNTTVADAVFTLALQVLGNRGTAGFVTRPRGEWQPDMMNMLAGGKKLVGILGGSANPRLFIPKMIEFWRQGRFPLEKLVTTYKFAEFDKAWHDCEAAAVVKPVLVMESA